MTTYTFIPSKVTDGHLLMPQITVDIIEDLTLVARVFQAAGWDMPNKVIKQETHTQYVDVPGVTQ